MIQSWCFPALQRRPSLVANYYQYMISMAVAAFRSTTKRNCQISVHEADGASFCKQGNRKTKCFRDYSCTYLSDSSSSSRNRIRPFSRHLSSDSESDADGNHGNHLKGRRDMTQLRNWIDEPCYMTQLRRQVHSQIGGDSTSSIKHRTSLTSHDHSQISEQTNSTYTKRSEEKRPFEDRSKTQEVEERRLRAVHAQTQSDAGGSYENHPKARHYMMQLRNQIDEPHPLTETQCEAGGPSGYCSTSKIKHRSPSSYEDLPLISNQTTSSREERRSSSQTPNESFESIERPVHEELTEDGASISNIYAAKLHQSHQRARELRLQLEQEEQRCAEFAKSVCELHSETSSISCRRTRSGRHQAEENLKFQQDLRDLSIINEVPVFNSSSMPISGFKISEGKCFSNAADINPREFVQNYSNQDVDATEIFTSETDAYVTQVSPNNLQLQDGFQMHGQYIAIHDLEFMKTEKCSLFLKQATSICLEHTIENVDCMEENASLLLLDAILSQRKLFRSRIAQGRMLLCGGKL